MSFIKRKRGFSIIEVAVILAIASILISIGGLNYFKFVRQAKSKEAKHALSHLYLQEKTFYNHWHTYHENLFALGAMPNGGDLAYDVGFKVSASDISITDGLLDKYPNQHQAKDRLKVAKCATYKHVCESTGCLKEMKTLTTPVLSNAILKEFFGDPDNTGCSVKGDYVSVFNGITGLPTTDLKADANEFKAIAIGQITSGTKDIWSIDQNKAVKHEQSGL